MLEIIKYSDLPETTTVNLSDKIAVLQGGQLKKTSVQNLPDILAGLVHFTFVATTPTATFTVPAGKTLNSLSVGSVSAQTFNLGTTANGDDLLSGATTPANGGDKWDPGKYFFTETVIHFSNLSGSVQITLLIF